MTYRLLISLAVILASGSVMAADVGPRYILRDRSADRGSLPFSEGVLVGNTLYVAGHIGIDPKTDQAAQNPDAEAKLVMDAVEGTVKSAGLTMGDLVSVTVYCTDLDLYGTF